MYDQGGAFLARPDQSERFFKEVFWRYDLSRLAASHYDSGSAPYSKYLTPGGKKRGEKELRNKRRRNKQTLQMYESF